MRRIFVFVIREWLQGGREKSLLVSLMNTREDLAFHLVVPFADPVVWTQIFVKMFEVTTDFLVVLHVHTAVIVDIIDPTSSKEQLVVDEQMKRRSSETFDSLLCLVCIGKTWIEGSRAHSFFPIFFQTLGDTVGKHRGPFIVDGHILLGLNEENGIDEWVRLVCLLDRNVLGSLNRSLELLYRAEYECSCKHEDRNALIWHCCSSQTE